MPAPRLLSRFGSTISGLGPQPPFITEPMTKDNAHGRGKLMANPNRSVPVIAAILAASAVAGVASGASSTGDPRKCGTNTPGDSSHHAYWCAKTAATVAARTAMASRQNVPRWYAPTFCDMNRSLLRWKCLTFLGGDHWTVTVTFRALSTGWHRYVTVVAQ